MTSRFQITVEIRHRKGILPDRIREGLERILENSTAREAIADGLYGAAGLRHPEIVGLSIVSPLEPAR